MSRSQDEWKARDEQILQGLRAVEDGLASSTFQEKALRITRHINDLLKMSRGCEEAREWAHQRFQELESLVKSQDG